MWKPSSVEDIRAWMAGDYVPNPTREEFDRMWLERIRSAAAVIRRPRG